MRSPVGAEQRGSDKADFAGRRIIASGTLRPAWLKVRGLIGVSLRWRGGMRRNGCFGAVSTGLRPPSS